VADSSGKELARAEPPGLYNDTELSLTPPADGDYHLTVRDLYGAGGPRSAYRLRVTPAEPDYALTVAADRYAVAARQAFDLPIAVQRVNGFAGAIDVAVEGLPAGVEAEIVPGTDPTKVVVRIKATSNAFASGPFRIVGRARVGPAGIRVATAALPTPFEGAPVVRSGEFWLTVTRPPEHRPNPARK
jgi:hypothetical protein